LNPLPYPEVIDTIRSIQTTDQPVYLVGGAVRDILLKRPVHDMDFALPGAVRPLARQVADRLGGAFYVMDEARDTVRVICKQIDGARLILDFAALRAPALEDDLLARDFTINALAISLNDPDRLIDPLHGAADLHNKILRMCSSRAFQDDPARILRAVRHSLDLNLRILPETYREMCVEVPLLRRVSSERQRDELFKILEGKNTAAGIRVLAQSGALTVILPELVSLQGVKQSSPHVLDVWEHTLATVQELEKLFGVLTGNFDREISANLTHGMAVLRMGMFREQLNQHFSQSLNPNRSLRGLLFLAALFHDSGKPEVSFVEADGRIRFIHHEHISSDLLENRAKALAFSQVEIDRCTTVIKNHMRLHFLSSREELPSPRSVYRFFRDCGLAGVDVCLLSLADLLAMYRSTLPQAVWQKELEVAHIMLENWWNKPNSVIRPPRLLNGNDLKGHFGLAGGPIIGKLLEVIQEAQAVGEVISREGAFQLASDWLNGQCSEPKE
jgi:poly(A) polymerase